AGTVCITIGGDVQKLGIHWVAIAWNEHGAGCIVDYDFYPFLTEGRPAADCELLILEGLFAWHEAMQSVPFLEEGTNDEMIADLTLIDTGWKDDSWILQPVHHFSAQVGFHSFNPSEGESPNRAPTLTDKIVVGDNWRITFGSGIPTVIMTSDHWKL